MVDRLALVSFLARLDPADLGILLAAMDGATRHVSRQGTVAEQAAELIRWAESSTGQKLEAVEKAARELFQYTGGPGPEPAGQIWTVPHSRNAFFQGRDKVIEDLRRQLTQDRRAAVCQAIIGLGGIGKTQTAVEYAYRYRDEYRYVLWLNAESPLSLKTGAAEHAARLQLKYPENNLDAAEHAFRQWLGTEPGWLLILDNADDPSVLPPFLPESGQGHVLTTSRANDLQDLGVVAPVGLDELSPGDAATFLLHRCRREDASPAERVAASDLARELDGLPLALEQAAAFIVERTASFQGYLQSFRSRGLKLFDARLPALGKYKNSVTRTWAANFEAVKRASPSAADVLRLSAFLAPDAIPFELLTMGASQISPEVESGLSAANHDPLAINELLHPLARFSLVRIDPDEQTYGIHRMVQEVIKATMDPVMRKAWVQRAVRAASQILPVADYTNWRLCSRLLPHVRALALEIKLHAVKSIEAGTLLGNADFYLDQRGQYAEAEPFSMQAMEIRREVLGERHPDYAKSLNDLAVLYRKMGGQYTNAERLYRQAVEVYRASLGDRHPDYAQALNNLAGLYRATGRHAEAEPLCQQALEINREVLGDRHPGYAQSLNNLAVLYRVTGRHADSERLYREALAIRREALGERHPACALSLNNLAGLYRDTGRHAEAEPLFREALAIRREALGERHPHYARSLNSLAILYRDTGRHAEAEPLFREALAIRREALGERHPDYAASLNNLAELYLTQGRHVEAEPLLKELEELRRQGGAGH